MKKQAKKSYTAPKVTRLGNIGKVTQGNGHGNGPKNGSAALHGK